MSRLTLTPPETFTLPVEIPTATRDVPVRWTFKYRDRPALLKLAEQLKGMTDAKAVAAVAVGWELDDPFTPANIRKFCDAYPGAGYAVLNAYMRASTGTR